MRFKVVSAPSNAPVEIGAILSLGEAAQLCEANVHEMAQAGTSPAGVISPDGEIRLKICDDLETETPDAPGGQRFCCRAFSDAAASSIVKVCDDGTYRVHGSGIVSATRCPWCGDEPIGRPW